MEETYIQGFRRRLRHTDSYEFGETTNLYAIQEGMDGPLKIGVAVNPLDRLKTLQQGNHRPLRLLFHFPAKQRMERFVHRELTDARIRGEWFRPTPTVLDVLEEFRSYGEICAAIGEDPDLEDVLGMVDERIESLAA